LSASEISRDVRYLQNFVGVLLDPESGLVLDQVIAQLQACAIRNRPLRRRASIPLWEFEIPSVRPLKFLPSSDEAKRRLRPEIFCHLVGPGVSGSPFQRPELVIRVWSMDRSLSYRPELDASSISDWLNGNRTDDRVIFRLHFDKANQGQRGTVFHLHVGGKPVEEEREKCWLTGLPGLPRIPAQPMDLILACELVIANFFHDRFQDLCQEPEWRAVVKRAEQRTIRTYYGICSSYLSSSWERSEHTLLKRLWNV
jgi:hypothetical protein